MKKRKEPMRQCAGCREKKTKNEMIRVVRTPNGEIALDKTGKLSGRGAYICPKADCFNKARKARSLERSLSCQIPEEVYDSLEGEMTRGEQ